MNVYEIQATVYILNIVALVSVYLYFVVKVRIEWLRKLLAPAVLALSLWSAFAAYQSLCYDLAQWKIANALVYSVTPFAVDSILFIGYKFLIVEKRGQRAGDYSMSDLVAMSIPLAISLAIVLYVWIITLYDVDPNLWYRTIEAGASQGYGPYREIHSIFWQLHVIKGFVFLATVFYVLFYIVFKGKRLLLKKWAWISLMAIFPLSIVTAGIYLVLTGFLYRPLVIDPTPIGFTLFLSGMSFGMVRYSVFSDRLSDKKKFQATYDLESGKVYRAMFSTTEDLMTKRLLKGLLADMAFLGYRIYVISLNGDRFYMKRDQMENFRLLDFDIEGGIDVSDLLKKIESLLMEGPGSGDIYVIDMRFFSETPPVKGTELKKLFDGFVKLIYRLLDSDITGIVLLNENTFRALGGSDHKKVIRKTAIPMINPHLTPEMIKLRDFYTTLSELEDEIEDLNAKKAELTARNHHRREALEMLCNIIGEARSSFGDSLTSATDEPEEELNEDVRDALRSLEELRSRTAKILDLMEADRVSHPAKVNLRELLDRVDWLGDDQLSELDGAETVRVKEDQVLNAMDHLDEVAATFADEEESRSVSVRKLDSRLMVVMGLRDTRVDRETRLIFEEPFSVPLTKYSKQEFTMGSSMFMARKNFVLNGVDLTIDHEDTSIKFIISFNFD